MAKFILECPSCGNYVQASSGFFAKKKINCSCGYVIDVKTERVASRKCAKCGNEVVFDQAKGEKAKCPVCHEHINTVAQKSALVEFSCPTCSCRLSASKGASNYVCPLCDTEIDVVKAIAKEENKKSGVISVIKYEGGNDVLVWKHPMEDFNLGSQLIVHESQEAIFFKDGAALDLFTSGRHTLTTDSIPIIEKAYNLVAGNQEVFHSEVYFINKTVQMGIKWGTDSRVRLFDPASGLHIEIGASGSFNIAVNNSRKLLVKLVGTTGEFGHLDIIGDGVSSQTMTGKFKSLVMTKVKANLARAIKENNINILEIDSYIDELSVKLRDIINENLEEYGLYMPDFFITSVLTPDDDPNFMRLKQQFADKTLRVREEQIKEAEAQAAQSRKILEAQTEAQLKMVGAQGEAEALKIQKQAEAEAYKMQAYAEAEEMRAKGYTYGQESSRLVGMEAMKNGIVGQGGGGAGSVIGDVAGLGIALGAMGGVMGMTKDMMNPMMETTQQMGAVVTAPMQGMQGATWNCACGMANITSKFCPNCGTKKPEPPQGWNCACGMTNVTSKFCPNCGSKKPEAEQGWTCACGQSGIKTNFCPNCGSKKPE